MKSRHALLPFIGLVFIILCCSPVHLSGADYPTRTISLIVPYPAGGVTDLGARAVADAMTKHLGQPVVVVNRVGGGTTIGGYAVSSAKPDGYTLGFFPISAAIPEAFAYFQDAPYSSKDLRFVSSALGTAMTFTVKEEAPWNTLKEFIEYGKKNPGTKVSTGGKQTSSHMFLATLDRMEKAGFVGVPFSGDSTNLPALLGGHVTAGIMDYSVVKSLVDAKKLKVLATVTEKRADFAPKVPTVVELGYPILYVSILGIVGPNTLPEPIVQKLDALVSKICTEPDFQTTIRNTTLQINYQSSDTYQASLTKFRANILKFFQEEGLIKK
jgi:tripartite-type tricarboxylate transporter receptor subunit TctC